MFGEVSEEQVREEIRKLKAQGKCVVEKLWGWELWLENNDRYCGKLLYILPGFQSSLHYHKKKDETFIALAGVIAIEFRRGRKINEIVYYSTDLLRPWCHDTIRIEPGTPHRFWCLDGPCVVMEVSTTHDDGDVVRLEDSRAL